LKLLGGKLTLDVYKQPVLGSPDAPHVLVELVSYDCPHCRKAHSMIKNGRARYGDQLAVVVLPVPLEKSCNRLVKNFNPDHQGSCALARYALTVASINPAAFEEFHEWLMTGDKAPSTEKTMAKAYELVGRDRARSVADGDDIKTRISENVDLFASLQQQHSANRNFGLPVQIMKNGVMSGAANQPDAVYRTWEEHLGLEPPLDATKL
jgi:protein-disulfide isomerase